MGRGAVVHGPDNFRKLVFKSVHCSAFLAISSCSIPCVVVGLGDRCRVLTPHPAPVWPSITVSLDRIFVVADDNSCSRSKTFISDRLLTALPETHESAHWFSSAFYAVFAESRTCVNQWSSASDAFCLTIVSITVRCIGPALPVDQARLTSAWSLTDHIGIAFSRRRVLSYQTLEVLS